MDNEKDINTNIYAKDFVYNFDYETERDSEGDEDMGQRKDRHRHRYRNRPMAWMYTLCVTCTTLTKKQREIGREKNTRGREKRHIDKEIDIDTNIWITCTTLTTKQREIGREKKTRSREKRVMRCAQIPGPSSHAKQEVYKS